MADANTGTLQVSGLQNSSKSTQVLTEKICRGYKLKTIFSLFLSFPEILHTPRVRSVQVSKNKVYRQFWEGVTRFARTQPRVLSSSEDEQLSQVWAGRYACLLGSDFVLAYWQSLHCHLSGVIVQGLQKPAVFYLQKNSPYTSLVSEA